MKIFDPKELKKLAKGSGGQVTIIGGSDLFHGAPILALKVASRVVDMVFFASPEPSLGQVAEQIKSELSSFIWVPWEEAGAYIEKSDAILIGPGLKRWRSEKVRVWDKTGRKTKQLTEKLLRGFPRKQWVIDAGSLQVMDPRFIPPKAILTPNAKEYELLFDKKPPGAAAKKYSCIVVKKAPTTVACSSSVCVEVGGGNVGLTKGGTGDVLAGLTVALAAQNPPFLAAAAASWLVKKAADNLYQKVGRVYNADDLAREVARTLGKYLS